MSVTAELPRYRCHKQVWALQIKYVIANPRGFELHFFNERYAPIEVDAVWVAKHSPAPGGYFVVYDDGYKSYSPAKAFEEGYSLIASPSASLDEELGNGSATATLLVEHVLRMGASAGSLPVRVNGKAFEVTVQPGGWDPVNRGWRVDRQHEFLGRLVADASLAGLRPFIGQTCASATSLKMHNHEVPHDGTEAGMIRALEKAVELASTPATTRPDPRHCAPRPTDHNPVA